MVPAAAWAQRPIQRRKATLFRVSLPAPVVRIFKRIVIKVRRIYKRVVRVVVRVRRVMIPWAQGPP